MMIEKFKDSSTDSKIMLEEIEKKEKLLKDSK